MTAPLTRRKMGSTHCPACEESFSAPPFLPITETTATDLVGGRKNYKANRPVEVTRRWHTLCLAYFEAANEAYRKRAEADSLAMVEAVRKAMS